MQDPPLPSWGVAAPQLTAAEAAAYHAAHPLPEPTLSDRLRADAREAAAAKYRVHQADVEQASRCDQEQAVLDDPQASAGAKWAAEQNLECARANRRFAGAEIAYYSRIVTPSRTARPRERRPRAQAHRSSVKSGDSGSDGDPPPEPRPTLRLAPPPRAAFTFACLTPEQRGEEARS